jgi:hypothetical protein
MPTPCPRSDKPLHHGSGFEEKISAAGKLFHPASSGDRVRPSSLEKYAGLMSAPRYVNTRPFVDATARSHEGLPLSNVLQFQKNSVMTFSYTLMSSKILSLIQLRQSYPKLVNTAWN